MEDVITHIYETAGPADTAGTGAATDHASADAVESGSDDAARAAPEGGS